MRYRQFCYFYSRLILAFLSTLGIADNSTGYKLCTSQICNETAKEILKSIDNGVKPCDDFYKHACGRWFDNYPTLNPRVHFNQVEKLQLIVKRQVIAILEKNGESDCQTPSKVQDYYNSCMNLEDIEARDLDPLQAIVSENGGWPLILPSEDFPLADKKLTLQKMIENYGKVTTGHSLFSFAVMTNRENDHLHKVLRFTKPITPTSRYPNQLHKFTFEYMKYIRTVATELATTAGCDVPSLDIDSEIGKMIKFELSLNKLYSREIENPIAVKSISSIAKLQEVWNSTLSEHPEYAINWLELIKNYFDGTAIQITEHQNIGHSQARIFRKLAKVLKHTPLRTVVNYVHWHAIHELAFNTNRKMRSISNDFYGQVGLAQMTDYYRSYYCADFHNMREGLSYAFVKSYFGDKSDVDTLPTIANEIKAEMKRQLNRCEWMNSYTKRQCTEKVDAMKIDIGYPDSYDNVTIMTEFYSDLTIGDDFFDNVVNTNRFNVITSLKKLRDPIDKQTLVWSIDPRAVTMVYMKNSNSILAPAAILQKPVYSSGLPLVMNYGTVGTSFAHEAGHAFDSIGRLFDQKGSSQRQWWSEQSLAEYMTKSKCFVDQYDSYTLTDNFTNETIKIDGTKTLDENIADNVGFKIALKAYLSYKTDHTLEDIRLPGLQDFTDEQLFFYSLGNCYCGSQKTKAVVMQDPHSPESLRINGVLSNMKEFSKAFKCPRGSPMNREKKCVLWD